jgi:hypothetical protein
MQLILFLGAGVSVPSGLPTAEVLTDRLFSEVYHDDGKGTFSPGPGPEFSASDVTERVRELLRLMRIHDIIDIQRVGLSPGAEGFTSSGAIYRGTSTYEDLFFLCQQISLWNSGLSDNSLTTPFMESIERKAQGLLRGASFEGRLWDLARLGQPASDFIESVVADALRQKYVAGFELVRELATAPGVEKLHLVTLNHDTLLEQYLTTNGVEFVDGFGGRDGDVRWSDDCVFDAPSPRVRILKLHGSVNWYSFARAGRARTAILETGVAAAKDGNGKLLTQRFRRPSFLSGINKMVSYQRGIYADIHFRFNEVLRQCERIIMSGYGWGDTAISFQLDTWLDRRRTNRIILLHQNPQELTERSMIMASGHDAWMGAGQLICINRWLADVTLLDLAPYLH